MKTTTLLLFAVLAVSCNTRLGKEQRALDGARDSWNAQGLTSYVYGYRPRCFCIFTEHVTITVIAGAVTSVVTDDGNPVDPALLNLFNTIDGLLETVQDAIDRSAHSIELTYDDITGVPAEAYFDYEENTIDEEFGFTASNPTPIP